MKTTTHSLSTSVGPVDVTLTERGAGRPFLLLHGGAGPLSVMAFADRLAGAADARVLTPTHPGFGGTPRPEKLQSVRELAAVYAALLEQLELKEVTVVGYSIGGWIAAELALASARVGKLVVVDAAGIEVEGHPVADVFTMPMSELMQRSYANPAAFAIDPSTMSEAQRAGMAANRVALGVYAGKTGMTDASLRGRLSAVKVPTLVQWGAADRVVDVDYGRAYAAAIPGARFEVLPATGHMPQLESPAEHLKGLMTFVDAR
jgi:pimeloyl-ACP methyl ester carboxylesterase